MKLEIKEIDEAVDIDTLEPVIGFQGKLTIPFETIQNASVSPELADKLCLELGIQLFNQLCNGDK